MSQLQRSAALINQHSSSADPCTDLVSAWVTAPLGGKGVGSSTPLIGSWTLTRARQQMTATDNGRYRLGKVLIYFIFPLDAFKLRQQADRRLRFGRYFKVAKLQS